MDSISTGGGGGVRDMVQPVDRGSTGYTGRENTVDLAHHDDRHHTLMYRLGQILERASTRPSEHAESRVSARLPVRAWLVLSRCISMRCVVT